MPTCSPTCECGMFMDCVACLPRNGSETKDNGITTGTWHKKCRACHDSNCQ